MPDSEGNAPNASVRATVRASDAIARAAAHDLPDRRPDLSARQGLTPSQRSGLWSLLGAAAVFAWARPEALIAALAGATGLIFAALVVFRIAAALRALLPPRPPPAPPLPEADLPSLTCLVPLYREGNMAARLIDALEAIDYPRDRLDVIFLTEADDAPTSQALLAAGLPPHMRVVELPPGLPRTKPKALNCGLALSTGDILAVFDAEDRPDPHQARAAAAAFAQGGKQLAVVQAPLLAHNPSASWIARQFAVEYAMHFKVWLPLVAQLGLPLALGGTSNYFRRTPLVAAGGWDPWNVTEDADLGLRLARLGFAAGMIAPPTLEEAPVRFGDWLNQRTRWIKGHLQTWLVLMRHPGRTLLDLGPIGFLATQIFLGGGLLSALIHGPMLAWTLIAFALPGAEIESWQAALMGAGYGSVAIAAIAARQQGLNASVWASWPVYWMLMSLAMARALIDLKLRPHHWSKTPHGVSPAPSTVVDPHPPAAPSTSPLQGEDGS